MTGQRGARGGSAASKTCAHCGASFYRQANLSRRQWDERTYCDRNCSNIARFQKPHECQCGCGERPLPKRKYVKGHRPIKPMSSGYRRVWVTKEHPLANADGNCLEHRLVLHEAGIDVPRGMHVHHRNGDKLDNRVENLELIAPAEHTRKHIAADGFVVNQYGKWPLREVRA